MGGYGQVSYVRMSRSCWTHTDEWFCGVCGPWAELSVEIRRRGAPRDGGGLGNRGVWFRRLQERMGQVTLVWVLMALSGCGGRWETHVV